MKKIYILLTLAVIALASASAASAHYVMIFPGEDFEHAINAKYQDFLFEKGQTGNFCLLMGHHFEYYWSNLTGTYELTVMAPSGKTTKLPVKMKNATSYVNPESGVGGMVYGVANYTFEENGPHYIYTTIDKTKGDGSYNAKMIVFVGQGENWKGWDKKIGGQKAEIVPYSRTMNLRSGHPFSARYYIDDKPADKTYMTFIEPSRNKSTYQASKDAYKNIFEGGSGDNYYLTCTMASATDEDGRYFDVVDEPGLWVSTVTGAYTDGTGPAMKHAATFTFPVLPVPDFVVERGPQPTNKQENKTDKPDDKDDKKTPGFTMAAGMIALLGAGMGLSRFRRK